MKKLIIHIEDLDKYQQCETVRYVATHLLAQLQNKKVRNELDRYLLGKQAVDVLREEVKKNQPQLFNQILKAAEDYNQLLEQNRFEDFVVRKNSSLPKLLLKGLWYLLTLPLFLYGFIFNVPMYYVPVWMTSKIKDPSFHTSVRFVHYMFLYPLYYLAVFLLSGKVIEDLWIRLAFVVSLPLAGFFAISWARGVKKFWQKLRFRFSPVRQKLISARNALVEQLQKVNWHVKSRKQQAA